jgi:hypothetical protein
MDKKKNLVFRYFDTIFSGYKKHGRRPVYMDSPYVLYEYKNNDGRVAFEYSTDTRIINFQNDDFYTTNHMLGVPIWDMVDICKSYCLEKFGIPSETKTHFYTRNIK